MCGRLVGGVGPKMKSCYPLRVKQRLAFCCPLLPNKIFTVFQTCDSCRGYSVSRPIAVFCENDTFVSELCRNPISVVHLAMIFDVKTLLNVTDFLPTAFWITATYSLLFTAANSKNQKCLNWIGGAICEQLISISVGSIQTNLLSWRTDNVYVKNS